MCRCDRTYKLQKVFEDTMFRISAEEKLADATRQMIEDTQVYVQELKPIDKVKRSSDYNIRVVEDTAFNCARKRSSLGKVAVLNFANAYHPGGGVARGALAQEECLCRSSNLYAGLVCNLMQDQYYNRNKQLCDAHGSDSIAYHPGVVVFKDDELYPNMLDEKDWCRVDVITCAAPNLRNEIVVSEEEIYELHVNRGRRIIEAGIANQAEILILGAFGCGAFCNDPRIVASAYKYLLIEEGYAECFKEVIFAIKKDQNDEKGNCYWFKKVLEL